MFRDQGFRSLLNREHLDKSWHLVHGLINHSGRDLNISVLEGWSFSHWGSLWIYSGIIENIKPDLQKPHSELVFWNIP